MSAHSVMWYLMWLMSVETIFEAIRATGNRAIVSAGWAGLGAAGVPEDLTDSVYILTSMSPPTHMPWSSSDYGRGLSSRLAIRGRPTRSCLSPWR